MIRYAEVLDQSWWEEEVALGFAGRAITTLDENGQEVETVLKWKEYCTNSKGAKNSTKIFSSGETPVLIKEFVNFIKGGNSETGTIIIPKSYSSDKIRFVEEREVDVYKSNAFLIHLFTDVSVNISPKNLDWDTQLNVGLDSKPYKWKGQILSKKFYYKDLLILEKEYYHVRDISTGLKTHKGKRFYWYKADGTRHLLKDTGPTEIKVKSDQVADLIKQTNHAIEEAYAFTVGEPIQPYADAYFLAHAHLVEQDKRTGGTLFKAQIASEDLIQNAEPDSADEDYNNLVGFLFYPYDTSHLTHDHGLGETPTIQEVLVDYLTFK